MSDSNDKRRFHRILFNAPATISDSTQQHSCRLIDISLRGALVFPESDIPVNNKDVYTLTVELNKIVSINMSVRFNHINNGHYGFQCDHIDMDSLSHLKRLVELNLGEPELLDRELSALNIQE